MTFAFFYLGNPVHQDVETVRLVEDPMNYYDWLISLDVGDGDQDETTTETAQRNKTGRFIANKHFIDVVRSNGVQEYFFYMLSITLVLLFPLFTNKSPN